MIVQMIAMQLLDVFHVFNTTATTQNMPQTATIRCRVTHNFPVACESNEQLQCGLSIPHEA